MHSYIAYGLRIQSALALPELVRAEEGAVDVVVRLDRVRGHLPDGEHRAAYRRWTDSEAYFFWEPVGAFLARGGKEIVVDPAAGVAEEDVRGPLEGIVLGAVAHQRGLLVLHASAVTVRGETIAFIGERGRGKSTMAAALYRRGHALVADDVLVLGMSSTGKPVVFPGFPQ